MGKLKYLLLLILNTCIAGSVYILALKLRFMPIMAIYQVLATISVCIYIFLAYRYNNLLGIAKEKGVDADEEKLKRQKKTIKNFIVIFCPFLLVVLCDYTYLLLIANNPFFSKFLNLF